MKYYKIYLDENSHYLDENDRQYLGAYETAEDAIKAAEGIIDESLRQNYEPGLKPEQLYKQYRAYGEDPFIVSDDKNIDFSAMVYAKYRCKEICKEESEK